MCTRIVCAAPVTPCEADLLTWSARFHREMFYDATTFNGDLSSWNVSKVTSMMQVRSMRSMSTRIVCSAPVTPCEADLLTWSAHFHRNMFCGAAAFNGDLSSWNVSNVTNMSQVRSMRSMSTRIVCAVPATPCEADLLTWSAYFHREMFEDAAAFNGDLSSWNVSNVTNMR